MDVFHLDEQTLEFPPVDMALSEPDGLLAIGGDLRPERILEAYAKGIFPWYSDGQPILWWSPNPRAILNVDDFKVSKSLRKSISVSHEVKVDEDFRSIVETCAKVSREGQDGTWITQEMIEAYCELFDLGYAHCVAVYKEGELWGGLYGLSLGGVYFGESMFSLDTDGSKVALYHLMETLKAIDIEWIDCQVWSEHLASLGAITLSRPEFMERLVNSMKRSTTKAPWPSL